MTDSISFKLNFQKFNHSALHSFSDGLHVIYGESGSGKTQFIRGLTGFKSDGEPNFTFNDIGIPNAIQIVFQNPENQILSHTLESELAFAPENQFSDTNILQQKLGALKNELPMIHDWHRHPATLSGGEMEMLNLVTAFSTDPDAIFIDDGLSFLNENSKHEWIKWMRKKISDKQTVLWFTSDPADLLYGDTQWELSLSGLKTVDQDFGKIDYNYTHPPGKLTLSFNEVAFSYKGSKTPTLDCSSWTIDCARSIG
ncbi:MAG: ATP-binding cassette domain-containing protein, partial [Candidatus Marinimicrobia bacterium]|nr:ATP-binding cassette domain-containing protein [Candidatus Neomarinimicrobiota bacterium]